MPALNNSVQVPKVQLILINGEKCSNKLDAHEKENKKTIRAPNEAPANYLCHLHNFKKSWQLISDEDTGSIAQCPTN